MGNVLSILKRDVLRLLKTPAAMVVVIALLVLPSLYTWYNVEAFWNPYDETGNLRVCVVNQDKGAENDLVGELNVGDEVTEELLANEQLEFVEEDMDAAMADLEAGDVYAVYVIPENFTACLISPLTGQLESPEITYYVNEKLGPVSPKITDQAASTLERTINETFVATVSEAAIQAIDDVVTDVEADLDAAGTGAATRMDKAVTAVRQVRSDLAETRSLLEDAQGTVGTARTSLNEASAAVGDAQAALSDISTAAEQAQQSLANLSSGSVGSLSGILTDILDVTAKASSAADGFLSTAGAAQARVDLAASRVQPLIDAMWNLSTALQNASDGLPDGFPGKAEFAGAAATLSERAGAMQGALDNITGASARITQATQSVYDAAKGLDDAARNASQYLEQYAGALYTDVAPAISAALADVSAASKELEAALSNLDTTIKQAQTGLDQLDSILVDGVDALSQTDALIAGLEGDLLTVTSDIRLLVESGAFAEVLENGTLNAESIGSFMGSPTEVRTEELFHPNSYGTAISPLFMNLTFWIGAFMLVIIFRLVVDGEGVTRSRPWQGHVARFLLFAVLAVIQALICVAGVLYLGVQAAQPAALFFSAAVASLAYLSVIYALSTVLHHLGKALCIVLVFAQIPGGSGLYPLELTDGFFQAVYPFLPFSYGIDAMREAIGGLYGNAFAVDMGMLALCLFVNLFVGAVLASRMVSVRNMLSRQLREGDIYNGADVEMPEQQYPFERTVSVLAEDEGYRQELEERYERFCRRYPIFVRVAIVLGVGIPVLLVLLGALDAGEKVTLLTLFLIWLIGLIIFLVAVEWLRYSLERRLGIESALDESPLRNIFGGRKESEPDAAVTEEIEAVAEMEEAEPEYDADEIGEYDADYDVDETEEFDTAVTEEIETVDAEEGDDA